MRENKKLRIVVTVLVAVAIAAVSFLSGFLVSMFTRRKQVSSFEWALKKIMENYYEDIPADAILDGSLKGFADLYLDRYSEYYTAEEYRAMVAQNSGNMIGVGISYMYVPAGTHPQDKSGVLIETVVGNSPAFRSGLQKGEFITSLSDGSKSVEITSADVFSDFIDGKAKGEKFKLISEHGEHEVSKEEYTASYCTMSTSKHSWNVLYDADGAMKIDKTDEGIACLPDGAAYLRLEQFFGGAADEMAALAEEYNAEKCTSLILDLRGNGGGYVNLMCDISHIFVGQLPNYNKIAMQAVYKDGRREGYTVNAKYKAHNSFAAGTEISVLADNGTASASEALIGVLIDNEVIDYGDIYLSDFSEEYLKFTNTAAKNCKSYGKGIMQTTFVNPLTQEALKLTTAKIFWPKGETSIHDVGLTVGDGCKTVKTEWDAVYGDPQLATAVGMIYGN